ncbi:Telomerase protein component 1 [Friedmanniomyces endolithicus]|nr:Telomerase protein component 1 [Friedmanniomyces endolithicus]KAK0782861.1 Telomerase protein component 1 [Friedmanniomyces endolithicus]KAK0788373.1 Telomerase protein component 1 [Friedmanniomyces endolithicus]KAK0836315.1 Telomerase protein component 1 [Friedmanniomyces endolithicus]
MGQKKKRDANSSESTSSINETAADEKHSISSNTPSESGDVVFRPSTRVLLPTNDINIDFERRTKTKYGGFTMLSSVAHVWFNTFFEGRGPEQGGRADDSGVFEMEWEGMDGIKGSSRKGTRAFDRWLLCGGLLTKRSRRWEEWVGRDGERELGLRVPDDASAGISRASSMADVAARDRVPDEIEGVKPYYLGDNSHLNGSAES